MGSDAPARRGGTKLRSGFSSVFTGAFLGVLASNIAASLGRGIQAGIGDIVSFVQSSIGSATALQSSLLGVDAVFGKFAASVHKQAKTAAKDVGLSTNAYNGLATILGAQLKNLGTPIDQVSTKTSDLIKLGADLAAQYGGTTSDAVEALSAALRGERDPIERYGGSIKQAAVDAKAAALGFQKVDGAFDNNAQTLATLAILYEQTSSAQGAFVKRQDTVAVKQQKQAAMWEDISGKIGTAFLPVVGKVSDLLTSNVFPTLSKLVDKYGPALQKTFEDALPSLQQLADDVLPQLPGLITSMVQALPGLIVLLRVGLGLFTLITQNVAAFTQGWSSLLALLSGDKSLSEVKSQLTSLPGPLGVVVGGVTSLAGTFGSAFGNAARAVGDFAGRVGFSIGVAVSFVGGLKDRVVAALNGAGSWLVESGKKLIGGFIDGIRQMFKPVGDAVSGILSFVQDHFPHSPAKTGPFAGRGWTNVEKSGGSLIEQFNRGALKATWRMPAPGQLTSAGVSTSPATSTAGVPGNQTVREIIQVMLSGRVLAEAIRQYQRSNS